MFSWEGATMGMGWGGTRISGTGPEKSFPVIRARVTISIASNYILRHLGKRQKKRSHTDGNAVVKAVVNPRMISFVFDFEFVFTRFSIPPR
jgi:hypothetical protein